MKKSSLILIGCSILSIASLTLVPSFGLFILNDPSFDESETRVNIKTSVDLYDENSIVDIYLTSYDPAQKLALVTVIKNITGLGLGESKSLVESVTDSNPMLIKSNVPIDDARNIKKSINDKGGSVKFIQSNTSN